MPRIYCMNNIPRKGTDHLPDSFSLVENVSYADGILVRSASFDGIEFPESLVAIARSGADVSNIPLDFCSERGVVVFNTPGANANAVKEAVLCALLLGSRGFVPGIKWVHEHASDPRIEDAAEEVKSDFAGREIVGKKLGIVGLGATGTLVANAALNLGMRVFGYDPYSNFRNEQQLDSRVERVSDLADICANCDYISIHASAINDNDGLIGVREIGLMKPTAVLVNYARASIVNSKAVAAALNTDLLKAYVTDFATLSILVAKNAIITPHIGAATVEAKENCAIAAVDELVDYIENGNIRNSVNYPACDMGPAPQRGSRIAVLHRNVPGIINLVAAAIGAEGINLANITSHSHGNYAYALVDMDAPLSEGAIANIANATNVLRVRIVK